MRARILIFALSAFTPLVCGAADLLSLAAEGFQHEEVRKALRELPSGINELRDRDGKTALHWSALRLQFEDVLLLLQAGAEVNAIDAAGRTPLFYALEGQGDAAMLTLELLTVAGADVNRIATDGSTPLGIAVQSRSAPAVEFLLRRGAALEPVGVPAAMQPLAIGRAAADESIAALLEAAKSPKAADVAPSPVVGQALARRFAAAARAGDLPSVRAAIAAGAEVNQRDEKGESVLFRAVTDRRPDVVTLLLLEGANPNLANAEGKTPLMAAIAALDMAGTRATMLLLLTGADVGAVTPDGRTALSEAVVRRNNFAATWCIWQGAKLDLKTPGGTLMQLAKAREDWPSMIALLKSAGVSDDAPLPEPPEKALFDAVRAGDLSAVRRELDRGISAICTDEGGCSPLAWAAHYGKFEIVDLLVARGADVNQPNRKTSKTTLQELALWGRGTGDAQIAAEHMEQLLARGADPNLLTKDGLTALMIAARTGTTGPNLTLLLKVTTDVNVRSKGGKTALGLAKEYGHTEVAQQLIAKGASE